MKHTFLPFSVSYPKITGQIRSLREEAVGLAHLAAAKNVQKRPLALMMSGGLESEMMANAFVDAGIPFRAVTGRLGARVDREFVALNEHDTVYADAWCRKHKVEHTYVDVDIFGDLRTIAAYAASAMCFSPQYGTHMLLMKWCHDEGLFFVAGNGEMDLVLKDGAYYMMDEQREFTLDNFCALNNLQGVWQFWKQTGRAISAYIELPVVQAYMGQKCRSLLDVKHYCWATAYNFHHRSKRTGFEKVQEWDGIARNALRQMYGQYDEKFYTPLSAFKDQT
jgi:hypothetical protein